LPAVIAAIICRIRREGKAAPGSASFRFVNRAFRLPLFFPPMRD
jgi:hypothetical protein